MLAGLLPGGASAAVIVHIDQASLLPNGQDQIAVVDVWAEDPNGTNEQLNAFTVAIDAPAFSPNGIRFAPPVRLPSANHPYVFADFPGSEPEDFSSTFNRVQVGAGTVGRNDVVDITPSRNGLFSIPILVPKDFAFGAYPLVIDPSALSFGGAGEPIVVVPGPPGGFIYVPRTERHGGTSPRPSPSPPAARR